MSTGMSNLQSQPSLASTLPTNLPLTFMKEITSDFFAERVLGQSVFGTVYKGVLPEGGRMIAVKRLAENAPVPVGITFETEVTNLMALKHQNIVELVHYCHESQKKVEHYNGRYVIVDVIESCLCYKYLPKSSLDKYVYRDATSINWDIRFKIVKGICQGLHFLHKELVGGPLIHMNLVPNSIWLDDNWVPKIADFGLSRHFGKEQTRMYTVNFKGHNGYIAPEYLYRDEISTMTDIYSLGVIILEVTTRERNCSSSQDSSGRQFVDNIHQNWKTDEQIMNKYPSLDQNGLQQVKACVEIGLWCVEDDWKKRPSIEDIVNKLNGVTMNPTRGTMETPVSSSLGAMDPILRKVDLLLYPLQWLLKHGIQLLKEEEGRNDDNVEQSMLDSLDKKRKYWMHKVRELFSMSTGMSNLQSQPSLASTLPTNLTVTFMKEITSDFSAERVLGQSVFGTVYMGVLPEGGRMIAVKRLAENAPVPAGITFETEVTNLMALKHQNIVELVHYCHESQKKVEHYNGRYVIVDVIESCLCYKYLPKSSLDKYVYGDATSINWDIRFKIVKGICQGLHFLHKELVGGPLIHMNLVPNSIWLDDNWVPKIADFGLSRHFGKEQTRMYTVNFKGHNGYIAPEYLYRDEISTMTDIYSLGMIILEVTTRERNCSASEDSSGRQFVDNIHQNWKTDEQIMNKYPSLDQNGLQQVKACVEIGLRCVEHDWKKRPSIEDIVNKLNGACIPIFDQFKRADAVCIGDLDPNLPSGSKVTMNPSRGTMETPVSSSLGAMGPLLRKVDLLLTPKYPLRRLVKHAIQLLKEDLEDTNDALVEQSMVDSPDNKGKYWMHEVRELSYDIEDAIDALMLPHIAGNGKVRVRSVPGHRVGQLKIKGLPYMVKPLTRIARVTELRALLWEANERHQRYELDVCISNPSFLFSSHSSRIPLPREVAGNLVGVDAPKNELTTWLTAQAEQLKILCIVGPAGVGKTALAKELYRELGSQFECRAFVRVSRTPHISTLLLGILFQIQRPKQNFDTCSVPNIINEIKKHLQDKRYFIVVDGLWEARVWDIIKSAFTKGHNCSRIMITCEDKDVATKFCSYHSIDVFELKPLGSQDSEKLFFDTMSAFNVQCHDQLKEVPRIILRACNGLPLATIAIAGLLATQPDNHLLQYFFSDLANLTLEEMLKGAVSLCYNSLPQDLKTCLLYLTMYPEGCSIRKVDLLKQWIAEGFISPTTEEKERVAENYFAELVNRGMIQPEKIIHNDEVISCTVHHIVFDVIMHKSREVSFTAAVDYSQTVTEFFTKIYRLSLYFSCAQYATKLEGIRLSQIRSLFFYGLHRCIPSLRELKLLRVLILEFWADNDDCISLNLSMISGLFLLRYLKISSHMLVELPSKIQELKFLETMEIDARVWAIPDDIVHLPGLLHLSIQDEAKLPEGIGRVTSLQTLRYFDLGNNSEGNVRSLCELINLRDLHITCSTALSDAHLKRKFVVLAGSLLKLTNLRSLSMAPGAVSTIMFVDHSSVMLSTPMFLQRLELLPPICIFSRLPEWVGKLQKLRILKIVVRVLLSSDIDVLTGLPGLTVLSLYIRQPNTQSVVFSSGALPVLKYFKYTCGALSLAFQEEALPQLERLKLRFNVHKRENEMYCHMNSGIENLLNLKEMTVKIGAADDATESDKKAAESAIESAIRKHPRFPIYVNVRRIGWVEEV